MENFYTSVDHNEIDGKLRNIILMNETADEDAEDYDLDYDPNNLYYELQAAASFL